MEACLGSHISSYVTPPLTLNRLFCFMRDVRTVETSHEKNNRSTHLLPVMISCPGRILYGRTIVVSSQEGSCMELYNSFKHRIAHGIIIGTINWDTYMQEHSLNSICKQGYLSL